MGMRWRRVSTLVYCAFCFLFLFSAIANGYVLKRRGVEVHYEYRQVSDGFGNIRTVYLSGDIKNTTDQDVSRVHVTFKMVWKNRAPTIKKLKFSSIPAGEREQFSYVTDLGNRTDMLNNVLVKISKVKYSTLRKSSPPSARDIISSKFYLLPDITEEGRKLSEVINHLKESHKFHIPRKDEFETSNEYETRVNFLENEHFTNCMDQLEKNYGVLLGGKGSIVRFLPKHASRQFIYISENSFFFRIPIRLGRYNADRERFEDVNFSPRTILFEPSTLIPDADIELTHRNNMFFLGSSNIEVPRKEARKWRKNQEFLVLEVSLRMGVIQDGPYPKPRCLVERIVFLNTNTSEIYRQWQ
jgi:hypothetical protein